MFLIIFGLIVIMRFISVVVHDHDHYESDLKLQKMNHWNLNNEYEGSNHAARGAT